MRSVVGAALCLRLSVDSAEPGALRSVLTARAAAAILPPLTLAPSMRTVAATAVLAFALALAAPTRAQMRADLPGGPAPVTVYETAGTPTLGSLFNAKTLRLNHSYEFSYSSFAGDGLGLGVYTTSL